MKVRMLGRKLCAESVLSKKYDIHVEHSIAAGQYKNISMANVKSATGCNRIEFLIKSKFKGTFTFEIKKLFGSPYLSK